MRPQLLEPPRLVTQQVGIQAPAQLVDRPDDSHRAPRSHVAAQDARIKSRAVHVGSPRAARLVLVLLCYGVAELDSGEAVEPIVGLLVDCAWSVRVRGHAPGAMAGAALWGREVWVWNFFSAFRGGGGEGAEGEGEGESDRWGF